MYQQLNCRPAANKTILQTFVSWKVTNAVVLRCVPDPAGLWESLRWVTWWTEGHEWEVMLGKVVAAWKPVHQNGDWNSIDDIVLDIQASSQDTTSFAGNRATEWLSDRDGSFRRGRAAPRRWKQVRGDSGAPALCTIVCIRRGTSFRSNHWSWAGPLILWSSSASVYQTVFWQTLWVGCVSSFDEHQWPTEEFHWKYAEVHLWTRQNTPNSSWPPVIRPPFQLLSERWWYLGEYVLPCAGRSEFRPV